MPKYKRHKEEEENNRSPSRMVDPRVRPRERFVTSRVNARPRLAIAVPTRLFPRPLALSDKPRLPRPPRYLRSFHSLISDYRVQIFFCMLIPILVLTFLRCDCLQCFWGYGRKLYPIGFLHLVWSSKCD